MICKAISCHDVVMLNRTRFQFWVIHVQDWQPKGQMVIDPVGAAIMSHCVLQSMSFLGCLFNARSHGDHSHLTSTRPPLDVRCFFFFFKTASYSLPNNDTMFPGFWSLIYSSLIALFTYVLLKCKSQTSVANWNQLCSCKLGTVYWVPN